MVGFSNLFSCLDSLNTKKDIQNPSKLFLAFILIFINNYATMSLIWAILAQRVERGLNICQKLT